MEDTDGLVEVSKDITNDLQCAGVNVEATIQQLEELAYQTVKEDGFIDSEQLKEFQSLADDISELASQRNELHNALEVETISGSRKRHALQVLPVRYKNEMEEAVLAARNANEDEMKSLQKRLKSATKETADTNQTQDKLTRENVRLRPECDQIRKEHDQIIAQLNQRMSDKAVKQIVLNESRDALRDVQQQTADIDIGHLNLAEDMEKERQEAAKIKQDLLEQVKQTEEAIRLQKEKNTEEKKVTDKIMDNIMEMNVKINDQQKTVQRLENSQARLEMQSLQLTNKIDREKRSNQELINEKEVMQGVKDKQQLEYDEKIGEIEKKLKVITDQIAEARKEGEIILKEKDEMHIKTDQAEQNKSKGISKVKEASLTLEEIKKETTALVEKSAAFTQHNSIVREKMELLEENHKATLDIYNGQIDEYRTNLNQERQERVKVQELRDESEKVLETFRSEQLEFMNSMSRDIEDAVATHQKLTEKNKFLSRDTEMKKREIQTLEVRLEVAQSGLRRMKSSLQMDVERLHNSVELLEADNLRKTEYHEGKQPVLKELNVELEERGKEYSVLKDEVIVVRNKEKSINEQIKRTALQMDKLEKPMLKLKSSIKEIRSDGIEQLNEQAAQRKALEADIYHTTLKLEQVVDGNAKFTEASMEIQSDVDVLTMDMKSHAAHQHKLCDVLSDLEEQFAKAWQICIGMEKKSADQDQEILDGIAKVQEETNERSMTLSGISTDLRQELESLTGFVENVSSRRPKDTRQSKRRSVAATVNPPEKNSPSAANIRNSSRRASNRQDSSVAVANMPVPPPSAGRRDLLNMKQRRNGKRLMRARPVLTPVASS